MSFLNLPTSSITTAIKAIPTDVMGTLNAIRTTTKNRLAGQILRDPDIQRGNGGQSAIVQAIRDPAIAKQLLARMVDVADDLGLTLGSEPGDFVEFFKAHKDEIMTYLDGHRNEVASNMERCKQEMLTHPNLARVNNLSDLWAGRRGLGELGFPQSTYDYAAGTVRFALSAVPGVVAIRDARLVFADPLLVGRRVTEVKFAGNTQWVQETQSSAGNLNLVTEVGRYNVYHPRYRVGDGFRLGHVPLGNNTGVTVTVDLWPGVASPSVLDCYLIGKYDGGPAGVGAGRYEYGDCGCQEE